MFNRQLILEQLIYCFLCRFTFIKCRINAHCISNFCMSFNIGQRVYIDKSYQLHSFHVFSTAGTNDNWLFHDFKTDKKNTLQIFISKKCFRHFSYNFFILWKSVIMFLSNEVSGKCVIYIYNYQLAFQIFCPNVLLKQESQSNVLAIFFSLQSDKILIL